MEVNDSEQSEGERLLRAAGMAPLIGQMIRLADGTEVASESFMDHVPTGCSTMVRRLLLGIESLSPEDPKREKIGGAVRRQLDAHFNSNVISIEVDT